MKVYMVQWYSSEHYDYSPYASKIYMIHHECNLGMVKEKASKGCDKYRNCYYNIFDLEGFKLIESTLPVETLDCP